MNQMKKIPVSIGDTMIVIPDGMAEKDPYVKIDGYIIFIKNLSTEQRNAKVKIKITAVKPSFGFAEPIQKTQ